MRRGHRRRIAEGVYQDGSGVAATVHVGTAQLEERFPAGTSLKVIQRGRQVTAERLRANRVHLTAGTLAADVEVYLPLDRPRREGRLPLVTQAVAALREFFDAKAEGRFSTSSVRQSFRRACAAYVKQMAATDPKEAQRLDAILKGVWPYH